MIINNVLFNVELRDIINELITQMRINHINYMQRTKETDTHIQVCCPYHNNGMERRPSAGIRKSDGKLHCFACGEVHELPEVISHCLGHYDDVLGKFGWNWLLKNFASLRMEERNNVKLDFIRNKGDVRIDSINGTNRSGSNTNIHNCANNNKYVSEEELDNYRYYHSYWTKRGITDNDIIELFDLGYSKKDNCITFPVRDIKGNCLFVAKRSTKTKWFNYPEGVEKPLYGLYELHQLEKFPAEIIICESMLDCLYFWTIDKYAVALNGLGNDLQFKQLNKLPCRKFILCTDSDKAGMKARKRIRANLKNKIITEYLLPEGRKDANDCTVDELKSLQEVFGVKE